MKILILFLLFILSSCVTQQRCFEKFGSNEHTVTTHTYKDTTIYVQGATVRDTLKLTECKTEFYPHIITDSTGKAQLRWYKDAYGNLVASCTALKDTLYLKQEIITKNNTKYVEKSFDFGWLDTWYIKIIAVVTFIGGLFLLIKKLFNL